VILPHYFSCSQKTFLSRYCNILRVEHKDKMSSSAQGIPNMEEMKKQQQQQQQNEDRRASILEQILEPAAKNRMSRLALVKKEYARSVEDSLINAATAGQLKSKVTEEQLIAMLEQFSGNKSDAGAASSGGRSGIVIQRRKTGFEDDDDDDDSDLQ
jgi:programmed cell death protein 5